MAPKSSITTKASATVSRQPTALHTLWTAYVDSTPARLKLIDAFLVFLMLTGAIQFMYCVLVSSFPFNAFLAGLDPSYTLSICNDADWKIFRFASCVGQFVLAASLRSQVNPLNKDEFKEISPERYACSLPCTHAYYIDIYYPERLQTLHSAR